MNPLKKFTINTVSKKLNEINFKVLLSHQKPLAQASLRVPNLFLLSNFAKRTMLKAPQLAHHLGICKKLFLTPASNGLLTTGSRRVISEYSHVMLGWFSPWVRHSPHYEVHISITVDIGYRRSKPHIQIFS